MKQFSKIFVLGVALVAMFSCNKLYDYEKVTPIDAPTTLCVNVHDLEYNEDGSEKVISLFAPKTKTFVLTVDAKSISDSPMTCVVRPDPDKVEVYNKVNNTSYQPLSADCYSFTGDEVLIPRYNTSSTQLQVTLKTGPMPEAETEEGTFRLLPISIMTIEGEDNVKMTAKDSTVYVLFCRAELPSGWAEGQGTGTVTDPYVIKNSLDMLRMSKALKSTGATYFKMMEDVDMTDQDWVPINTGETPKTIHFDGNNKKIKNLACNAEVSPSMFGTLLGSIKDLTFESPKITILSEGGGLLGRNIGVADGARTTVSNITVTGLVLDVQSDNKATGSNPSNCSGGFSGYATNADFINCTVAVEIVDGNTATQVPNYMAGMVGRVFGEGTRVDATFTNCHTTGSVVSHHSGGGLIGYAQSPVTVDKCSSKANVLTYGNNAGGLIAYCASQSTITNSFATGTVYCNGNYAGGLLGGAEGNMTIKKCYAEGKVTLNLGGHAGGLIGNPGLKKDGTTMGNNLVEDCYASGDVQGISTGSNGRMIGGLIGAIENSSNNTVTRCYASGSVIIDGPGVTCGGLMSFGKTGSTPAAVKSENLNLVVEKCIAWNPVVTNGSNNTSWSAGAVIGVTNIKHTLTDCYRRKDMDFNDGARSVYDQENSSPSTPLVVKQDDSNAVLKNAFPYHGKAAGENETLSAVATRLAWPATTWDLSGDAPKLIFN